MCLVTLSMLGARPAPADNLGRSPDPHRRGLASVDAGPERDARSTPGCSLEVASGNPLRQVDETSVVMRLEMGCAQRLARRRWLVDGKEVPVTRTERTRDHVFCVLHVGRLERERVTVAIVGDALHGNLVASLTTETMAIRPPLATLELPEQGAIDFIPKNREARVSILAGGGHLVLLPVPDAYRVRRDGSGTYVQGRAKASGPVSLRFAYRIRDLPAGLGDLDLAIVTEPIARPIRATTIDLRRER